MLPTLLKATQGLEKVTGVVKNPSWALCTEFRPNQDSEIVRALAPRDSSELALSIEVLDKLEGPMHSGL